MASRSRLTTALRLWQVDLSERPAVNVRQRLRHLAQHVNESRMTAPPVRSMFAMLVPKRAPGTEVS
jgi:hypothetical protein